MNEIRCIFEQPLKHTFGLLILGTMHHKPIGVGRTRKHDLDVVNVLALAQGQAYHCVYIRLGQVALRLHAFIERQRGEQCGHARCHQRVALERAVVDVDGKLAVLKQRAYGDEAILKFAVRVSRLH